MVPEMVPESIQNWSTKGLLFGRVFFHILGGLGALQVPLGSLLGLSSLSWGPLESKNLEKLTVFHGFWKVTCFAS